MTIRCEKCTKAESTVLVIEEPEWPHDPVAGWFKCDECHAKDPDGWSYVLDAKEFGDVTRPPAKAVRATPGKRADDDLIERAYRLHVDGMSMTEVAREVMKVHPYKNVQSACASLRKNFAARGLPVYRTRKAVAA